MRHCVLFTAQDENSGKTVKDNYSLIKTKVVFST